MLGKISKKSLQIYLQNIFQSKFFFVLLIALFLGLGFFLLKNNGRVKGNSAKSYNFIVYDDFNRLLVKSSSFEAEKILAENNIKVWPEDIVEKELVIDPVRDNGAGEKIIIYRAPVFYLEIDGKNIPVRNWDSTVETLIKKSGETIHGKDIIEPALDKKIVQGETIKVTRVNEEDMEVFEDVPFETVYKASPSVPFGQKQTTQEGKKGQLKKTYHVVYQNGVEVKRWLKGTERTIAKQDKIITTGVITGRANFGYYSGMVTSFYKGMTGRYLLVTNLANGKQVKVKIIGSGPFNGPLMDMGTEPFQAIGGSLRDGYLPQVSVQLLD